MKKYDRLFAFGCSFTNFAWPAWPEILAYDLGIPLYNFGASGGGNQFIFNTFIQAKTLYNFTENDLVIVCWTNVCREDRWINKKWLLPGNIFTQQKYSAEFVEKYIDPTGCAVRDFAYIAAVDSILSSNNIDFTFLSMLNLSKFIDQFSHEEYSTNSQFGKLISLYKPHLDKIKDSFYTVLWNDDIWYKMRQVEENIHPHFKDYHPTPLEHMQYLEKTLHHEFKQTTIDKVNKMEHLLKEIIVDSFTNNLDVYKEIQEKFMKIRWQLELYKPTPQDDKLKNKLFLTMG